MAQVEIGGAKITGGKIFFALPILAALGSGAWGGFTLYQEFLDLREATANYVSPDLSHIDKHISYVESELKLVETEFDALKDADDLMNELVREQVNSIKATAGELQTQVHDSKITQKEDLLALNARVDKSIEAQSDKLEKSLLSLNREVDKVTLSLEQQEGRNRETISDSNTTSRNNVKTIRDIISAFEIRMDAKIDRLDTKIDDLEKDLDDKIMKALTNPLIK